MEIVQQKQGGIPRPAYSATQYEAVVNLYLRAALQAGRWPEITTHFLVDKGFIDGHKDPRCFDLGELYRLIRVAMSHPPQTTYGILPVYGTGKAANIWWTQSLCGGPPPSQ